MINKKKRKPTRKTKANATEETQPETTQTEPVQEEKSPTSRRSNTYAPTPETKVEPPVTLNRHLSQNHSQWPVSKPKSMNSTHLSRT